MPHKGFKHSEESKQKMRATQLKRFESPEARAQLSQSLLGHWSSLKGKKQPPEQKQKRLESVAAFYRDNPGRHPGPQNEEQRKKVSEGVVRYYQNNPAACQQRRTEQLTPDGICDLCGSSCKTHKDHDHVSGEQRGNLCRHCNTGLGHFKDDVNLLRRALEYLAFHRRNGIPAVA